MVLRHATSRRWLLRALPLASTALLFGGVKSARAQGSGDAVCRTPDEDGLPASLEFVAQSPHADRSCSRCEFWTAAEGGGCGACEMMRRTTPPTGYCTSFAQRAPAG